MKKRLELYKQPVMLVGFMGSGKSAVGELLSQILNLNFIDTDNEIVKESGMTIPDIFLQKGEPSFRALETEILRKFSKTPFTVISCGGGIVLSELNRKILRENTFVIWLKCPVEICHERCRGGDRPLLKNEDSLSAAKKLYSEREHLYSLVADFEINTEHSSPDEIAHWIAPEIKSMTL